MITPEQIRLVQESFALFRGDLENFAEVFYIQLFEKNPNIQYMYRGNQKEQAQTLAGMLDTIIIALADPNNIEPALQSLGRRHVGYGVRAREYQAFGEALEWTLKKFLGTAFKPEVQASWDEFFKYISAVMQGQVHCVIDTEAELGA